jgi:hypothetical protein
MSLLRRALEDEEDIAVAGNCAHREMLASLNMCERPVEHAFVVSESDMGHRPDLRSVSPTIHDTTAR